MSIPGTQPLDARPEGVNESELVHRMREGDEQAFADVVRIYGPRMLAVARRFLQHDQDAQDAVQDAFISAFRSIDKFQEDASLGTWLHRIAVNAALMKLRRRKRKPERSIDDLLPTFGDDGHMASSSGGWAVTHDTAVHDRETRELVRKAIDELPESHRTVLLLRDIEERSTEETAQLLGISEGAVKTRLHRARQALRSLLDAQLRGEES